MNTWTSVSRDNEFPFYLVSTASTEGRWVFYGQQHRMRKARENHCIQHPCGTLVPLDYALQYDRSWETSLSAQKLFAAKNHRGKGRRKKNWEEEMLKCLRNRRSYKHMKTHAHDWEKWKGSSWNLSSVLLKMGNCKKTTNHSILQIFGYHFETAGKNWYKCFI